MAKPPSVVWRFGESEEDATAWASAPKELHVYVDFRTDSTPTGYWYRVIAVTHAWVRKQLGDLKASHSWPAAIVVPDGSLAEMRASIDHLLGDGGVLIVAREAKLLAEADLVSDL